MEQIYFPFDVVRDEQKRLMQDISASLQQQKNIIAHAPTGLGKTAAALAPALTYALQQDKTVFFLTSRHTQHLIALKTLQEIQEKYHLDFSVGDIIGKKWMCALPEVTTLYSNEFAEFCKKLREDTKCGFYAKTRKQTMGLTVEAKDTLHQIKTSIHDTEKIITLSKAANLCPYEIALEVCKTAKVIICDYYYLFNPSISENFLKKIDKELEQCIVIVDEAHNLPGRLREFASEKLSGIVMKNAIKEAKKFNYTETMGYLAGINEVIVSLMQKLGERKEMLLPKQTFVDEINKVRDYLLLINDLEFVGDAIKETQKRSFIASIARFLKSWLGTDDGFTRILSSEYGREGNYYLLSYRCLDPAVVSSVVVNNAYSTILMSGTLTPTEMYRDLLGVERCLEKEYKSGFSLLNRLDMVVPLTTTKFTERSEQQFMEIAQHCARLSNVIKGNVLIFFPSYAIMGNVKRYFSSKVTKTIFEESPRLTKDDKTKLLDKFKSYKNTGAVLLCAASGSFGEGIDLPGDLLQGVIVVGLPLQQPDLETQELIKYFDLKYAQGWNYGYVYPAFQKCLQNAGRCIRTETDKGVIVFLDKRYILPMYYRCFPEYLEMEVTRDYEPLIDEFFRRT
ncbi:ATP-dependent DNA helicase [Candidatus Woesearchaeota archaeon]|nr:ATP-dependent DNA helicase [Candidatus Woesearchaeota archaeon]